MPRSTPSELGSLDAAANDTREYLRSRDAMLAAATDARGQNLAWWDVAGQAAADAGKMTMRTAYGVGAQISDFQKLVYGLLDAGEDAWLGLFGLGNSTLFEGQIEAATRGGQDARAALNQVNDWLEESARFIEKNGTLYDQAAYGITRDLTKMGIDMLGSTLTGGGYLFVNGAGSAWADLADRGDLDFGRRTMAGLVQGAFSYIGEKFLGWGTKWIGAAGVGAGDSSSIIGLGMSKIAEGLAGSSSKFVRVLGKIVGNPLIVGGLEEGVEDAFQALTGNPIADFITGDLKTADQYIADAGAAFQQSFILGGIAGGIESGIETGVGSVGKFFDQRGVKSKIQNDLSAIVAGAALPPNTNGNMQAMGVIEGLNNGTTTPERVDTAVAAIEQDYANPEIAEQVTHDAHELAVSQERINQIEDGKITEPLRNPLYGQRESAIVKADQAQAAFTDALSNQRAASDAYTAAMDAFTNNPAASADPDLSQNLTAARKDLESAMAASELARKGAQSAQTKLQELNTKIADLEKPLYDQLTQEAETVLSERDKTLQGALDAWNKQALEMQEAEKARLVEAEAAAAAAAKAEEQDDPTTALAPYSNFVDNSQAMIENKDMQQVVQEYQAAVDPLLLKAAQFFRNNKNAKFDRITIGRVTDRAANDIQRLLGIDVHGYANAINSNALNHIEARHGANGNADHTMANLEDVARIGYILDNYDSVDILYENGQPVTSVEFYSSNDPTKPQVPVLQFVKRVNGTFYVTQAVFDNNFKKLWVVSAYRQKAEDAAVTHTADGAMAPPRFTSENAYALFPASSMETSGTRASDAAVATSHFTSEPGHALADAPAVDSLPQSGDVVNPNIRANLPSDTQGSNNIPVNTADRLRYARSPLTGSAATQTPSKTPIQKALNPVTIVKDFARALDVGAAVGTRKMGVTRDLPKSVLGYYQDGKGYIALRGASDYYAAMHEIGHALQERTGLTTTPEMLDSLPQAFKDAYKPAELEGEAFAEFNRLYMLDRTGADATQFAGADFVAQFEKALKTSGDWDAVQNTRAELETFRNLAPAARACRMIVNRADANKVNLSLAERLSRTALNIETGVFDWTAPAERFDEAAGKKGKADGLRAAAHRTDFASNIASNLFTNKLTDANGTMIDVSYAQKLANAGLGGTTQDFDRFTQYMLYKHSLDRNAVGKPVFDDRVMNDAETREWLAQMDAEHPELATAMTAHNAWWDGFMQHWLVDTGMVDQDQYNLMKAMYPNYVPTKRVIDNYASGKGATGAAGNVIKLKRATGGTQQIINPFDAMAENVAKYVATVKRNQIMQTFDTLYQADDTAALGIFARPITQDSRVQTTDMTGFKGQLMEELEKLNAETGNVDDASYQEGAQEVAANITDLIDGLPDKLDQFFKTGDSTNPNTIKVIRPDGTVQLYEVLDSPLMQMFAETTKTAGKNALEAIGKVTRMMTRLTTGNNPLFSIKNVARDFQQGVNTGTWATNYATGAVKWLRAAREVITNGDVYQEYLAQGGGGSQRINTADTGAAADLRSEVFPKYGQDTALGKATNAGKHVLEWMTLDRFNEILETTTRYAEYRFGKHDRTTPTGQAEAFGASQESTTDFARHGSSNTIRALRNVVPFFNATLEGNYKTLRMLSDIKDNPKPVIKTVMNTAITAALASAIRAYLGGEEAEKDYALLGEDIKNQNIILPNPLDPNRRFIRIPVGNDPVTRAVYALATQAMDGNDPDSAGLASDLKIAAGSIIEGANPLATTIFTPLIDVKSNTSWYGSPIVSSKLSRMPVTEQYDVTTPQLFVALGRALNIAPKNLQYLAEQYTGFAGQMAIPALSPNRYTGQLNPVGAVISKIANSYTTDPAFNNDITDAFYDDKAFLEETLALYNDNRTLSNLRPDLTEGEVKQAYTDIKALTLKGGDVYNSIKAIDSQWARIEAVMSDPNLNAREQATLTREARMEIVNNSLAGIEVIEEWKENYAIGGSTLGRMDQWLNGGATAVKPTAIDTLDDIFKTDLQSGGQYMQRASDVYMATGKDVAVPHPLKSFSKDKIEYTIKPDEWNGWVNTYKTQYQIEVARYSDVAWAAMTQADQLAALDKAHDKAHVKAKEWYLKGR
jgi:hypothetical protein